MPPKNVRDMVSEFGVVVVIAPLLVLVSIGQCCLYNDFCSKPDTGTVKDNLLTAVTNASVKPVSALDAAEVDLVFELQGLAEAEAGLERPGFAEFGLAEPTCADFGLGFSTIRGVVSTVRNTGAVVGRGGPPGARVGGALRGRDEAALDGCVYAPGSLAFIFDLLQTSNVNVRYVGVLTAMYTGFPFIPSSFSPVIV